MTWNTIVRSTARDTYDEPLTFEALSQLWQHYDEPRTPEGLQRLGHPRTPHVVVIGWSVYGIFLVSILTTMPWLLRAVGGA